MYLPYVTYFLKKKKQILLDTNISASNDEFITFILCIADWRHSQL